MVEYRNKPENIYNWDNNHVVINYNIIEDEDKNGVFYKCDQVVVEIPLTYEKLVEFNEYNNFVENCKSIAKTII